MASRLDRFLVSENIMHSIGDLVADVLPVVGSDHWPIRLSWDWSCSPMGKPFCFEKFWMEHKDFKDLVSQWWQELVPPPGTIMFRFQQKLKALKEKICTWNREEFGNIFEDKKSMLLELDLINKKGMEGGWDEDMKFKEKDLMGQLEAREK